MVDDSDFESLNQFKWYAHRDSRAPNNFYAQRNVWLPNGKQGTIKMDAVLMGAKDVDHADGNGLNNQRDNLRCASRSQQAANRKLRTDNTSGFRGVRWAKGRWRAVIGFETKIFHLGYFSDPVAAAHAYDRAAKKYFGEFARLNFPEISTKPNQ